jgi:hypothetical protein
MICSFVYRQWKLQREKLHSDFTRALDTFQRAQRQAAQKEKDVIRSVGNFLTRIGTEIKGHLILTESVLMRTSDPRLTDLINMLNIRFTFTCTWSVLLGNVPVRYPY